MSTDSSNNFIALVAFGAPLVPSSEAQHVRKPIVCTQQQNTKQIVNNVQRIGVGFAALSGDLSGYLAHWNARCQVPTVSGPTLEAAQIERTTHPKLPTC